jgi:hypothetical protein
MDGVVQFDWAVFGKEIRFDRASVEHNEISILEGERSG